MENTEASQIAGTVYAVALNDRRMLQRMAPEFETAPYKAPPKAPILYIKPRNTFSRDGASVSVPADPGVVRIDATVGIVIGKTATRVSAEQAGNYIRGYVIVSDVTLPHDNYYRPAIVQRCRDGFCPLGQVVELPDFDLNQATLTVDVDGKQAYQGDFSHLVRAVPALIQDVTEFMTLAEGDVLLVGAPEGAPTAAPGQTVKIEVTGLGTLTHSLVAAEEAK